ncbi:hypothetical protein BEK98_37070 [Streptomyces diastatochromogenes]|uniref:Aminoglycoside phosphotransferase domain-containing protein n=1 Tax=Streptomyces diastatochromogenes TaxID=42236 RepID=A0A233S1W8_STRDA|nr:hypothetical protein BEK98_37070 [Streptomyces diastatochromogenes]
MCRRAFGTTAQVTSTVELGGGMYSTTYRIAGDGLGEPVILCVAPAPELQFVSEHELMRNEYAPCPTSRPSRTSFRACCSPTGRRKSSAGAGWCRSHLGGAPSPVRLGDDPRTFSPGFFARLGTIAKDVHCVGPHSTRPCLVATSPSHTSRAL